MFEAMSPEGFVNEAVPWIAAGFAVIFVLIMFIRMIIELWKDRD